jgi:hypothetical protein
MPKESDPVMPTPQVNTTAPNVEPDPPPQSPAQPNTPEADANIEAERQRYRTAGYDTESRLLGGPKGTLGG